MASQLSLLLSAIRFSYYFSFSFRYFGQNSIWFSCVNKNYSLISMITLCHDVCLIASCLDFDVMPFFVTHSTRTFLNDNVQLLNFDLNNLFDHFI